LKKKKAKEQKMIGHIFKKMTYHFFKNMSKKYLFY